MHLGALHFCFVSLLVPPLRSSTPSTYRLQILDYRYRCRLPSATWFMLQVEFTSLHHLVCGHSQGLVVAVGMESVALCT